ncbi:hypothetical protein A5746_03655 [Mycolicibacterium conceptionense]|uniref:Uncharacterized protein n=2 Tax=Mycolicibacterium TaxID=1866885 RepID=A0ACD1FCY8_MYCFR|nr:MULTISPECIES: hypothetical protein [Mycolicibacterium]OBK01073.1 hypothetical protein A5639_02410 [Mycolicibacterium conceptionense]OMB82125.1 hypothetical protein A5746_03655 [Mycolicibacterium conceptionense]OMB82318.1 hypothetical protein A5743_07285 [Mycolicibacterium conceptionense]OMB82927.1 hypothetical protein A5741_23160 [Mycolicibacterium conceptionense]QZH64911.1 hypothetical protein K6L26_23320 [Mycolicibacterium farcinogenes]
MITDLLLVAAGAAVGAPTAVYLYRNADRWRIIAINSVVCALLGCLTALQSTMDAPPPVLLVGEGLLVTAAPLTTVLLPLAAIDLREYPWRTIRRIARTLASTAMYCSAFAMVGYLSVYVFVGVQYKLKW